jgi:hypothetical protein
MGFLVCAARSRLMARSPHNMGRSGAPKDPSRILNKSSILNRSICAASRPKMHLLEP